MEPGRDDNRHFMNDKSNDLWLRGHGNKGNEEEAAKSEKGKALEVFRGHGFANYTRAEEVVALVSSNRSASHGRILIEFHQC